MSSSPGPIRLLDAGPAGTLSDLTERLALEYGTAAHPELVRRAPELTAKIGASVRELLSPPDPELGLFVLRGLPVDDTRIGRTPPHWSDVSPVRTASWDIMMMLLASAMGRPFGWAGQQDGKLVHNLVPSADQELAQTGMSSAVQLSPHCEGAFHPRRAHLLMLACMRNRGGVSTHVASVRRTRLDAADRALLATPTVPILPDDSYGDSSSYDDDSPPVPTLWEREDGVCLRFDPAHTPLERAGRRYRVAYLRLGEELRRVGNSITLEPGDVLVMDNDAVVHGRQPFTARYDGTDRWLKRINVRVPGRRRPAFEEHEHGYGQEIVDPYWLAE
ncbi:TfdA family taurine catabolism dioxygenase TauD [Herbihabitans rhizosphaerae]|uniref:TfdA family taurine catabolism dioxygenase TauD n=1 Tax=Herbihabitans rhizosphaerae TaxID=1872711 RepID=A0A4Q7L1T3_9PSEU|nr:TauD/TfdA family dioxygenase [Herbihabitans rhizosphaerae]RZS43479.1 TfdA family taurine catabolism dioxygenase TauD [Herbihabitans rhizosphaerae]